MTQTIQRTIFRLTCLMALVIFVIGCGGNVEEPRQDTERETAGTITYTEKNPENGILRGTYTRNDHTISFEVIRGEETSPEAMLIYPGVTSHSIDVRICDESGFCFINGAGGHALADERERSERLPTSEASRKNFESAWALHGDLDLQIDGTFDGLEEEVQSLKDATNQPPDTWRGIPPEFDPLNQKPKETSCDGTPNNGVLSFIADSTAVYTQIFQVWRQKLAWPIAYHSSSYAKAIDASGQIASIFYTCNHGACANGSVGSMTLYCSRNFSERSSPTVPMDTRCADSAKIGTLHPKDDSIGCCASPYSYVPLALSHVCNDDTRLQRDMMIADGPVSASFCADRYLQGQAPYCW
jgi:hypothetical protein